MSEVQSKQPIRHMAKWAGRVIMLAALLFVGRELVLNWEQISSWRPEGWQVGALALLAIAYGLSNFLLAENWHQIASAFGEEPRQRTYKSFVQSQIAKYLPGNFAHLLGRALLLRGGRISDVQLGQATLVDMSIPAAAALICVGVAALFVPLSDLLPGAGFAEPFAAPIALLLLAAAALTRFVPWPDTLARFMPRIFITILIGTIFMGLLGAIFAGTANIVGPTAFLRAGIAAILGWLVGYLTPGAPGGLGTREAFLLVALNDAMPETDALIAITLFRLVTVAGDVIFYLVGIAALRASSRLWNGGR